MMSISSGLHVRAVDVENMDHAQVDSADRGFVVVDQSRAALGVRRVDRDLFGQLAAHPFVIRGRGHRVRVIGPIVDRDVSADADALSCCAGGLRPAPCRACIETPSRGRRDRDSGRSRKESIA